MRRAPASNLPAKASEEYPPPISDKIEGTRRNTWQYEMTLRLVRFLLPLI